MAIDFVEVRPSSIQGLGVFALRAIPKSAVVCQYKGVLCRRGSHDPESAYLVHVTNELLLDGKKVESVGKYINSPKGTGRKSNVKFGAFDSANNCFPVLAKRAIKAGEELLIAYGRGYWTMRCVSRQSQNL
jgi:SET domain-containing protein